MLSATAFGAMAILAQIAYSAGTEPFTLLFLRFSIAAGIMVLVALVRQTPLPRGRLLGILILMGGIFYAGQSLSYFVALTFASAGLVVLLLSLYPLFVTILAVFIFHERMTLPKWLALGLALGGTALTIGPVSGGQPVGVVLSILSALIYAVYIVIGSKVGGAIPPMVSATVIMAAASVTFGSIVTVRGVQLPVTAAGWTAIIAIAVVSTVMALVTFLAGLEIVGPTNAAMLSMFEPVTVIALSTLILKEQLQPLRVLGGLMIIIAVVIITKYGQAVRGS